LGVLGVNNTPEPIVPTKLAVRLDGGSLYSPERPSRVENGEHAYDGFVTPGPHTLEVEVGAHARARTQYAFTQKNAFAFEAPDGNQTTITILVDGEAPIAEDFPGDHQGQYEVRMRARVRAEPLPGAGHR